MKKLLVCILSVLLLFSTVTACGFGDEELDWGDWEDFEWTTEQATDWDFTKPTVTLRMAVLNETGEKETAAKFKKVFEQKYPNIKITLESINADYTSAMFNYISTDNMPDIVWCTGENHLPFSSRGHFADLTPYMLEAGLDVNDFQPTSIQSTHYSDTDEKVWFMPRDYNKPVIYYNREIFDAAGVAYPKDNWTWTEFRETCAALRVKMDANTDPKLGLQSTAYPFDPDFGWNLIYYTMVKSYGADILDASGNPTVETQEMRNVMTEMRDMVDKKYAIAPSARVGDVFLNKQAAMWSIVRPRLVSVMNAGIDVDFAPFPAIGNNPKTGAGCSGYAISSKSSNKDAAWRMVKFIVSEEGQRLFGSIGQGIPVLKSMQNSGSWTEYKPERNLNHLAFTLYPERDVFLNYTWMLDGKKQKDIFDTVQGLMYQTSYADYGIKISTADKLGARLKDTTEKLQLIIDRS